MKRQRNFLHSIMSPTTPANSPGTSLANHCMNSVFATTRRGLVRLSIGTQVTLRKLRDSCARVANCITLAGSRVFLCPSWMLHGLNVHTDTMREEANDHYHVTCYLQCKDLEITTTYSYRLFIIIVLYSYQAHRNHRNSCIIISVQ
jgi:hypothetical protein